MKTFLNYLRKNIYAIPLAGSLAIILNIVIDFTGLASMDQAFIEANETLDAFGPYGIIFLVFIFAPIIEELIFRKLIYKVARKFLRFIFAALISAILFGAVHLNITQFIYAFILGLLFCYGYEMTNTIFTPIFMHGFANLFVVLIYGVIASSNASFMNKIFIIIVLTAIAAMSWYRWHEINDIKSMDIISRN